MKARNRFVIVTACVLATGGTASAQFAPASCVANSPQSASLVASLRAAEDKVSQLDQVIAIWQQGITDVGTYEAEGRSDANWAKGFAAAKSVKATTDSILVFGGNKTTKAMTETSDALIKAGYAVYDNNRTPKGAADVAGGIAAAAGRTGYSGIAGHSKTAQRALTGVDAASRGDAGGWCAQVMKQAASQMGPGTRAGKLQLGALEKACAAGSTASGKTEGTQTAANMDAASAAARAAANAAATRGYGGISQNLGKAGGLLGKGSQLAKHQETFFEGLSNMQDMDDMKLDISMRATGQRTQMQRQIKIKTAERNKLESEARRLRAELGRLGACDDGSGSQRFADQRGRDPFGNGVGGGGGYDGGYDGGFVMDGDMLAMVDRAIADGSALLRDPSLEAELRGPLSDSINWLQQARREASSPGYTASPGYTSPTRAPRILPTGPGTPGRTPAGSSRRPCASGQSCAGRAD